MTRRNMHPEDIKAAVRKTGISLAELGRKHGISDSSARKACYLPRPAGNRVIAKHLGKTLNEIWPEWFDAQGNRITSRQPSRIRRPAASQKEKAA